MVGLGVQGQINLLVDQLQMEEDKISNSSFWFETQLIGSGGWSFFVEVVVVSRSSVSFLI
jgi:hypothetical protein